MVKIVTSFRCKYTVRGDAAARALPVWALRLFLCKLRHKLPGFFLISAHPTKQKLQGRLPQAYVWLLQRGRGWWQHGRFDPGVLRVADAPYA